MAHRDLRRQIEEDRQATEDALHQDEIEVVIQVNGKVRGRMTIPSAAAKEEVEDQARKDPNVQKWIEEKTVRKVVVIPGKLVNIVAG